MYVPHVCVCVCARRPCLQAPIDVLGVVTSVGLVGSVKRKSDNSDLTRRDITLADASSFSVVLTLWGDAALREDFREGAILQVGYWVCDVTLHSVTHSLPHTSLSDTRRVTHRTQDGAWSKRHRTHIYVGVVVPTAALHASPHVSGAHTALAAHLGRVHGGHKGVKAHAVTARCAVDLVGCCR